MNPFIPKLLRRVAPVVLVALGAIGPAGAAGPGSAVSGSGGAGGGGGGGGGSAAASVAGEVLVKLRSSDALALLLGKYPLTLVSRFGARPIYRLKVIGTARVKDVLASLALEPDVMIAEANAVHQSPEARKNVAWVIGTPQDAVAQWAPQTIRLAQAQQIATGSGVRVAVLDTGVDATHPWLAGRLAPGFDFVDFDTNPAEVGSVANLGYGHGTHVAGLIAMVAPSATIIPLRVLDADGMGNAWVLAEAMLYAIDPDGDPNTDDGAHVINLSLGSLARTRIIDTIADIIACVPAIPDDAIGDRSDPGYADDSTRCRRAAGAVIIAAAGNDASDNIKEYPAAEGAHGLLAVAASTAANRLASFSNSGSWIGLAAPGEGITSSVPGGGFGTWSGTSMAAPFVAGVAALLRSSERSLSPVDVIRRLTQNAAPLCAAQLRSLDAAAVLRNVVPPALNCP